MAKEIWEVWVTGGQGGFKAAEFNSLKDALAEVNKCPESASFGIKLPDGTWYQWENNDAIF